MSQPVEGKPYRLVWWCIEHDSQQDRVHDSRCELSLAMGLVSDPAAELDCRFHKLELRQHGYERNIEWGEQ